MGQSRRKIIGKNYKKLQKIEKIEKNAEKN